VIVRSHINQILADIGAAIPPDGKRDYFRLHRDRFAMILAALPTDAGNRALEIGVNPGLFTQALVRAGYRVSGTDLFPEHRASLWRDLGVEVRRWNIDTEPPPYPPSSFDLIIFSEVIEHLANPPLDALAAMRELLVPGGYLLISTPNQFYLKSRLRVLADILLLLPSSTMMNSAAGRVSKRRRATIPTVGCTVWSNSAGCWIRQVSSSSSAYTAIRGSVSVWSGSVCCVTPIAGWSRRCSGA
jgi:2-polyprenyl-3-methyl-5-hydroxy-6-metoxy-1,4-benzoquinol methylase